MRVDELKDIADKIRLHLVNLEDYDVNTPDFDYYTGWNQALVEASEIVEFNVHSEDEPDA